MKSVLEGRKQTTLLGGPLTIGTLHETLSRIAETTGSGSRRLKSSLLEGLISRADSGEVDILVRIIFGEMRIGVNEGVMLEGIAAASEDIIELIISTHIPVVFPSLTNTNPPGK